MSRSTPPAADEFEISIIGPGHGESVVVHIGDNQWCVVDSCIPRGASEAAAVDYLNSFGTNALAGVTLIVASHWHDDHIRGLASILRKVPNASFYCPAAVESEHFFALAGAASATIQGNSGVHEFAEILGLISHNAATRQAKKLASPKWAVENRILLTHNGAPFPVLIKAMSPSDGAIKLALEEIAKLLPKPGEAQRRITSRSPNHASVALWIEAGSLRLLLGADLEHTRIPGEGWMAVLQCHHAHQKEEAATLFKVPHHGSANADYPEIWHDMLRPNPISVLTPYNRGVVPLPRPSDLARLADRTTKLYCTAAGPGKAPPRDAMVERAMRQQLEGRRVIEGPPGHVRVRWSNVGNATDSVVEMFHGAYQYAA